MCSLDIFGERFRGGGGGGAGNKASGSRMVLCQLEKPIPFVTLMTCLFGHLSRCSRLQQSWLIVLNNNKKLRSFESKDNIHKKEVGPYHGFGY